MQQVHGEVEVVQQVHGEVEVVQQVHVEVEVVQFHGKEHEDQLVHNPPRTVQWSHCCSGSGEVHSEYICPSAAGSNSSPLSQGARRRSGRMC